MSPARVARDDSGRFAGALSVLDPYVVAAFLCAIEAIVLDVPAESLPPALADHYLSLKARGLL